MPRSHSIPSIAIAVSLACGASLALAQTAATQPSQPQQPQPGVTHTQPFQTVPTQDQTQQTSPARIPKASPSSNVKGQHDMAGTVQSVDQNGVVQVQTGLGNLTVHFPDASQNLKKGDKIILHLSYSMDTSGAQSSPPPSS